MKKKRSLKTSKKQYEQPLLRSMGDIRSMMLGGHTGKAEHVSVEKMKRSKSSSQGF